MILAFTNVGGPIIPTLDGEYCRIITRDHHIYTGTILSDSPAAHVYSCLLYTSTGKLHLSSRYDVDQFIKKVNNNQAKPLSQLTDGLHLHTIQCPNEDTYQRIVSALDEKGYLFKKEI